MKRLMFRLTSWLFVPIAIIIMGLSIYRNFVEGDIISVILQCILLILMVALLPLLDEPSGKRKGRD